MDADRGGVPSLVYRSPILGGNAPTGHGHIYGPEHVDAWAHIAPPTD